MNTMTDKIVTEAVARAIVAARGGNPDECVHGYSWAAGELGNVDAGSVCHRRAWQDRVAEAEAAISAMSTAQEPALDDDAEWLRGLPDNLWIPDEPYRERLNRIADRLQAKAPETGEYPMTDAQIKHMANRFLMWRLPENFHPDAGISFKPTFNDHMDPPMRHNPTGTNLFDYTQAEAMIRHMLEGLPTP